MYLLDTNVIIELMAGNRKVVEQMADLGRVRVAISAVTVAEAAYGAQRSARPDYELGRVKGMTDHLTVLPIDATVAFRYAVLKAQLALRGELLEDNDLYIAATALAHGLTLVTHDRGFARLSDLGTEDWLADRNQTSDGL